MLVVQRKIVIDQHPTRDRGRPRRVRLSCRLARARTLKEAFLYCRDMDASLQERLETFSEATRYLIPGYQEAVDRMVDRLTQFDAGQGAPKPGEAMPPFAMPDEKGQLVTLDELLMKGPLAITYGDAITRRH